MLANPECFVASGTTAHIYRAQRGRCAVVKIIPFSDDDAVVSFVNEAVTTDRLRGHAAVVTCLGLNTQSLHVGEIALQEFRHTLFDEMQAAKDLLAYHDTNWPAIRGGVFDIVHTLQRERVWHGDLVPRNIAVIRSGPYGAMALRALDFGHASGETSSGWWWGHGAGLPPEYDLVLFTHMYIATFRHLCGKVPFIPEHTMTPSAEVRADVIARFPTLYEW